MSLTDEIMGLVGEYGDWREWPVVLVPPSPWDRVKARLESLETELNDLRQLHAVDIAWDKLLNSPESIAYLEKRAAERTIVPPRVESHSTLVNGLPCSSTIDND